MSTPFFRFSFFSINRLFFRSTNEQRAHFSIKPPKKFYGFRVCHANKAMFQRKLVRRFTLDCLSQFGTEVEDVKLILGNQHNGGFRKLTETKRRQFSELYTKAMENVIAGDSDFQGILITKIHVPLVMGSVHVHWRCTGDVQRDQEIEQVLEKNADNFRKKLGEMFFNTPVPPMVFVEDRRHLYEKELNKLLEIADYGMQYRAVSKVGAVLGSSSDTGIKSADPDDPTITKENVPARWLENWRRRKAKAAEKKRTNAKIGNEMEKTKNV